MTKCEACPASGRCIVETTGHAAFCGWAKSGGARRARVAELSAEDSATYPGLFEQARNAAGALVRVVVAAAKGQAVMVPAEALEERRAICAACPNFDAAAGRCRLCGCYTAAKLRTATEQCPDDPPRWTKWEAPQDDD
jgi:hypothetical protein